MSGVLYFCFLLMIIYLVFGGAGLWVVGGFAILGVVWGILDRAK